MTKKEKIEKFIVEHVHNGHNRPIGTFAAVKGDDGKVYIGYSKCQRYQVLQHAQYDSTGHKIAPLVSKGDKFNPSMGSKIALERARASAVGKFDGVYGDMPVSMKWHLEVYFAPRCMRFFKTLKIVKPQERIRNIQTILINSGNTKNDLNDAIKSFRAKISKL